MIRLLEKLIIVSLVILSSYSYIYGAQQEITRSDYSVEEIYKILNTPTEKFKDLPIIANPNRDRYFSGYHYLLETLGRPKDEIGHALEFGTDIKFDGNHEYRYIRGNNREGSIRFFRGKNGILKIVSRYSYTDPT